MSGRSGLSLIGPRFLSSLSRRKHASGSICCLRNVNALPTFLLKFSFDYWPLSTLIPKLTTHFRYKNPGFFASSGARVDAAFANEAFFSFFYVVFSASVVVLVVSNTFFASWIQELPFPLTGVSIALKRLTANLISPSFSSSKCLSSNLTFLMECLPTLLPFWSLLADLSVCRVQPPSFLGQRTPPVVLCCIISFWVGPGVAHLSSCHLASLARPACLG
jgi:hypothetical protein